MKVTDRIFKSVEGIWESYNVHPFILGIKDGTLEKEKFKFYMIQDYMYLLDYSKVFALGILKSKKEQHIKMFSKSISSIIDSETLTHTGYMELLGINPKVIEETKTSLTTESYTKYMLAVGYNEGIAEVTAAVLACSWSYYFIAKNIVDSGVNLENNFYKNWIEDYSSERYSEANDVIIDLIDELTINYSEEQINNIIEIVINCSRYEYMFWDMAWNKEM